MRFAKVCGGVALAAVSVGLTGCGGGEEPAPTPAPANTIECPSTGMCSPGTCCAGSDATGGRTFPCPNSNLATTQCDGGREDIVAALLASMTREEKYKFVRGTGWNDYDITAGYYIGNAGGQQRFGIVSLNMHDSGNGFNNIDITEKSHELFGMAKEIEQITSYPVSLNLASTWSEELVGRFGTAQGQEFRAKGANVLLGPALEIHRIPRNGRNSEYLSGESPYLGARLVKPYIRAVQAEKVLCSAKHFIANHQEDCRRTSNSVVDARTRYELYYPPFEAAVEADAAVMMCGYNKVNGEWNCGSSEILDYDLRQSVGFKGWVQSDWWAFHSFEMGINGGVDQEMPGTGVSNTDDRKQYYSDANLDQTNMTQIDSMIKPQLDYMLKYGLMEPSEDTCQMGECQSKLLNTVVTTDARQALSKELATGAVVLLKNEDNALPVSGAGKTIAVLGSACVSEIDWEDAKQWFSTTYYAIGGSGRVIPKEVINIDEGIRKQCEMKGCTVVTVPTDDVAAASAAAAEADVAILCGAVAGQEERDRGNLQVDQQQFIVDVAENINTTKVVLTMTAGTIVMPWIDNVHAAMTLFSAGKYTGDAFADNLFGDATPSAKTPVMYPKDEADTLAPNPCLAAPAITDIVYAEKLNIAWMGFDASKVQYHFGHGLSYTTFGYSDLAIHDGVEASRTNCPNQDADKGDAVACVVAKVTNTGARAGVEIAQLYMGYPTGLEEPPKVLRGFVRTAALQPNQEVTATFPIYARDLQTYSNEGRQWQDNLGTYTFYVGRNAGDDALTGTMERTASGSVVMVHV